jgi:hypothetical protein
MKTLLHVLVRAAACAGVLALSGCYVVPYGYTPVTTGAPANYDRSFSAAAGAMRDEGVAISLEDPGRGVVVGSLNNATVTANVSRQADGSVRVQFDTKNASDATLSDRISRSYDRRMGR